MAVDTMIVLVEVVVDFAALQVEAPKLSHKSASASRLVLGAEAQCISQDYSTEKAMATAGADALDVNAHELPEVEMKRTYAATENVCSAWLSVSLKVMNLSLFCCPSFWKIFPCWRCR